MDAQEIFDKVATHLFAQGEKAISGDGSCVYRGADGAMCAVGCLIPNEVYTPAMEGLKAHALLSEEGFIPYNDSDLDRRLIIPELATLRSHKALLGDLQDVHDAHEDESYAFVWDSTKTMREALRRVARMHNLNTSILLTLSFKDR